MEYCNNSSAEPRIINGSGLMVKEEESSDQVACIFAALDEKSRGYVSRDEFLERMLDYMDSTGGEVAEEIVRLIEPHERIGLAEFRVIYSEILGTDGRTANLLSQIEREADGEAVGIGSPLSARSAAVGSTAVISTATGANDQMLLLGYEEAERQRDWWETEAGRLVQEMEDAEDRVRREKERARELTAKVGELEAELHDEKMEKEQRERRLRDDWKMKTSSLECSYEQKIHEVEDRFAQVKEALTVAVDNQNRSATAMEILSQKLERSDRECRGLVNQRVEVESILVDYKRVAGIQITELQAERDVLEMRAHQLLAQLQEMRHLPTGLGLASHMEETVSGSTDQSLAIIRRSTSAGPVSADNASTRPRAQSEVSPIYPRPSITPEGCKDAKAIKDESEPQRLIRVLTMENRSLVERIAHLETVGFYQREKLQAATNCLSLADELGQLDVEELRNALTVERETVKTLQRYIESLTTKLIVAGHIDVFELS